MKHNLHVLVMKLILF